MNESEADQRRLPQQHDQMHLNPTADLERETGRETDREMDGVIVVDRLRKLMFSYKTKYESVILKKQSITNHYVVSWNFPGGVVGQVGGVKVGVLLSVRTH